MNNAKGIAAAKKALKMTNYAMYASIAVNMALLGALLYAYFGKKCESSAASDYSVIEDIKSTLNIVGEDDIPEIDEPTVPAVPAVPGSATKSIPSV